MNVRRAAAALALVVALGLAVSGLRPRAPEPSAGARPNVVLVVACTLRRDQLTPYGAPGHVSPFLDELARSGARFADAVDAAPWTRAASAALLTGRHAIEVGMIEPGDATDHHRLSADATTLAELLRDAGYETLGVTANPNLNAVFGFGQGYDRYHEVQSLWREQRGADHVPKPSVDDVVAAALALVDARARPQAPLYLRLVTLDTHEPIPNDPLASARFEEEGLPPRVARYRWQVNVLDAGLRRLWDALALRGYTADNTVFVVVNDHGEGLQWPPNHGRGHGNFVLPSAVEMPWIVAGPGVPPGHVVEGVASQVDVLPTLLGLVGVPGGDAGEGRDWSEAVRGRTDRTDREHAFVDTWFQRANRAAVYTDAAFCMHDFSDVAEQEGRQRLHPKTACYDRRRDPLAQRPLPETDPALLDALFAWRARAWAAYEAWPDKQRITKEDPVVGQLEALGYAEGEEGAPGGER